MLTAYLDFATSPPTYETVSVLMRIERERLARGEDQVGIVFLPGPVEGFRRDKLWPQGGAARRALLRDVVVPLCGLLPAVVDLQGRTDRRGVPSDGFGVARPLYGFQEYVSAYAQGIRPLRAREPVAREPDLVTITLREAEHWPERNSNVLQWLDAAARLQQRHGLRVVFVRDTRLADRPLDGFATDAAAARTIAARAALYSRAALNLFVSNGPGWLCLAMDLPTVMFRPADDELGRAFGREHLERCGLAFGAQLPGAPAHQRLVWEQDSAEAIVAAVEHELGTRTAAA